MSTRNAVIRLVIFCSLFILFTSVDKEVRAQKPTSEPPFPLGPGTSIDAIREAKLRMHLTGELPGIAQVSAVPTGLTTSSSGLDSIGDWSKIVFQTYFYDNYEVMITKGDGTEPKRLTFDPANDGRARLNWGGTRIVFNSDRDGDFELFTMNPDGSDLRQVTVNENEDFQPAWSPDGRQIAYMSDEDGTFDIFTINADGTGKRQLTFFNDLDCIDPAWSPDGSLIIFTTWDYYGKGRLWKIPAAGGDAVVMMASDLTFPENPAWSPDGTRIAFDAANPYTYLQDNVYDMSYPSGDYHGRNIPKHVTYEEYYVGSWAPVGEYILFNRIEYVLEGNYLYLTGAYLETYCMTVGACDPVNVRLPGSGLDFLPDWVSADLIPPSSKLVNLPLYSRQDGFMLNWQAEVTGLAQLKGFDLQFLAYGEWATWDLFPAARTQEWIESFQDRNTGDQLDFRLRAYDEALNYEAWTDSPVGDASTTLYTYQLNGEVTDNRGYPVPEAVISVNPSPVDQVLQGRGFHAWLSNRENITISAQAAGYESLPAMQRKLDGDVRQSLSFPPEINLINNGDFENLLDGWEYTSPISSTSQLTVTALMAYRHSGGWAAQLGSLCSEPCLEADDYYTMPLQTIPPETDILGGLTTRIDLSVGNDGSVYVLVWGYPGLYVFERTPAGMWLDWVKLDPEHASSEVPTYIHAAPTGEVFAIFRSPEDGKYYFTRRISAGNWEARTELPVDMPEYGLLDVYFDQIGGVYILHKPGISYTYRTPAGIWQPPVKVVDQVDPFNGVMTITPDDTLHFFWVARDMWDIHLFYKGIPLNDPPAESLKLYQDCASANRHLLTVSDEQGQVHLFCYGKYNTPTHITRYTDGAWSSLEQSPGVISLPVAAGASEVVVHALGDGYFRFLPDQGWYVPYNYYYYAQAMDLDDQGRLHFAVPGGYTTQRLATNDEQVSVWQQVNLPADLHKPTLSFMRRLRGIPANVNSTYEVSITQGITETQVVTGSVSNVWEQQWVDLAAWAGEQVTVTFTLHQAAGEPMVYLDLDDISIGAWFTPVIEGVSPADIPQPVPDELITIHGQNFIQKPAVYIDAVLIPAANVTWIDEFTLEAILPSNLGAGYHDVKVVNPGGQAALLAKALHTGYTTFVPFIKR